MIVLVMGVAGSGKSTIGSMLAVELGCGFLEGDDLHPPANIDKMRSGTPLVDADRLPWLARIHAEMLQAQGDGQDLVVACSALKRHYRERLLDGVDDHYLVYLSGDFDLIQARMEQRRHFMPPGLLASQCEALEPPDHEPHVRVDVALSVRQVVDTVLGALGRGA